MTTALVLAGTRPGGDPFAREMGVEHKALIELGGEPLLARVVGALQQARMSRILVSCNAKPVRNLALAMGAEVIASERGPSASVMAAFEQAGAPMVVTTSDHALLQGEWVRELIERTPQNADLSVMMCEKSVVEHAVPGTRRTYWRFADGRWSGCNLFYLQTDQARAAIAAWSMVEAHRKRPWRIAAQLGPGTLLSMALGRLSLAQGLERLGRRMGVEASLVAASQGWAAVDVDKRADLELAQRLLATRVEKRF